MNTVLLAQVSAPDALASILKIFAEKGAIPRDSATKATAIDQVFQITRS